MGRVEASNLILIGMPGAGKSTIGALLASVLDMTFLDTDRLLEERWGRSLQEMIDTEGLRSFLSREEAEILGLDTEGHVIATGGSVIYSARAMRHLQAIGCIIWLDVSLEDLEKRLQEGMEGRGVVRDSGQSLADLFQERRPLYRRYARIRIRTKGREDRQIVDEILHALRGARKT